MYEQEFAWVSADSGVLEPLPPETNTVPIKAISSSLIQVSYVKEYNII